MHTSTVTVAVFEAIDSPQWRLKESDLQVFTTKGTGPGGQHRNKTESCVVMRHLPTMIEARADSRSQHQNRRTAREMLEARVSAYYADQVQIGADAARRAMIGSGMRGDKVRTYREQDDLVTDHQTGNRARLTDVRAGKLQGLFTKE